MLAEQEQLVADLTQEIPRMVRQMVRCYGAIADQLGIHSTDLTCLGTLRDRGPATIGDLATELGLTTGAATRMVDRLDTGGFVRRTPDPYDRRRVIVELVPEAMAPVLALFAGQASQVTECVAGYSEAELDFLLGNVRRATDIWRTEVDRLRRDRPHAVRGPRVAEPVGPPRGDTAST